MVEYELESGQSIIVDTGDLAMMDVTCSMDIQSVKGVKNVLFGGEGLFNTVITGPGRVTLQTILFRVTYLKGRFYILLKRS